jgi:hypothetical protein
VSFYHIPEVFYSKLFIMSFLDPNDYFHPERLCARSKTLHHREVVEQKLQRCPECQQLNPLEDDEAESSIPKKYPPAQPGPDDELIDLSSTSATPNKTIPARPSIPAGLAIPTRPAARDRANHIPDLVIGKGEQGRREAIQAAQGRKLKSGFSNSQAPINPQKYTFVVSVAHYSHRPASWKKSPQNWSHTESDRALTSDQLTSSLLDGLRAKVSRSDYIAWLSPEGTGQWSLCTVHTVVVEPWSEPMTISQALEDRPFKVATDNKKRLSVSVSLAWQPEPPQASPEPEAASPASTQPTPTSKRGQKKDISQQVIKKEKTVAGKRPISAGSAERNTSAKRGPVRGNNGKFIKKEAPVKQELASDDEEEELPTLEEILANAGNNGGK